MGSATRADRDVDLFEETAQDLVQAFGTKFKAHLLAPRFRKVAADLDVSGEVVDQVVAWWCWGDACGVGFKDKDWDDMPNPGGYLHRVLPDLIQAYLDAKDKKAAELGVDPATFNLFGWLREHERQDADSEELEAAADEDHAEREAQEQEDVPLDNHAERAALADELINVTWELAALRGVARKAMHQEALDRSCRNSG